MTKIKELLDFDKAQAESCLVIGTDEAGRGPGAGPVFAAAVCFREIPESLYEELSLLNDSKKLSEKHREELFAVITKYAVYSIQQSSVEEIDKKNQKSKSPIKKALAYSIGKKTAASTKPQIENKQETQKDFSQEFLLTPSIN